MLQIDYDKNGKIKKMVGSFKVKDFNKTKDLFEACMVKQK